MSKFHFSVRAHGDLLEIAEYTLSTWGAEQALLYMDELEACCERLGDHPGMGRACEEIRPGLRRMEHGGHVIFYRSEAGGILVSRILHQRMIPGKHTVNYEEF